MKWIIKTSILLIIIIIVGVIFILNPFLKRTAVDRIETASGFPTEINHLGLSLQERGIMIKELELKNPKGYPIERALMINEISAVPKIISFAFHQPEFKSMVIDIPELNVVTRADGKNNIKELAANLKTYSDQFKDMSPDPEPSDKPGKTEASNPVHIDRLVLRLGEATMYDYKEGQSEPTRVTLNLGIERTYENVEDLSEVMSDVMASIMKRTLSSALTKELGGLFEKMEEKNPETADDIRNAAESIGGQLKGLFNQGQ